MMRARDPSMAGMTTLVWWLRHCVGLDLLSHTEGSSETMLRWGCSKTVNTLDEIVGLGMRNATFTLAKEVLVVICASHVMLLVFDTFWIRLRHQ